MPSPAACRRGQPCPHPELSLDKPLNLGTCWAALASAPESPGCGFPPTGFSLWSLFCKPLLAAPGPESCLSLLSLTSGFFSFPLLPFCCSFPSQSRNPRAPSPNLRQCFFFSSLSSLTGSLMGEQHREAPLGPCRQLVLWQPVLWSSSQVEVD